MNIYVMSREKCVRYCHKPHNDYSIIISINTPWAIYGNEPFTSGENKVLSILRVWFDDVDVETKNCMNEEHAEAIKKFVARFSNRNDVSVIVHCDAGVSRSAGVAAALSKYYNGTDGKYFDGQYTPNMWCYRIMLNELFGGCGVHFLFTDGGDMVDKC